MINNLNMSKIKTLLHYIFYDRRALKLALLQKSAILYRSDAKYLKKLFKLRMGKALNLDNPKTFNEKLQWLKLYNRKPEYTRMVDKYEAKRYVADIIGEEYIIPTLGVWERFEDINFDALPNQFVLKTTHGGGNTGVVICKDKNTFDILKAKKKLEASLKQDIYISLREWPYKNVKRRIIAEEYVADSNGELNDFKFFCFNGKPKVMLFATERNSKTGVCFDYFDMEFNHLPFEQGGPNSKQLLTRPEAMADMIQIAKSLSRNIPQVRVDLYNVDGRIFFGEMTFFDSSGMAEFNPQEWDRIFGDWIELPAKTI